MGQFARVGITLFGQVEPALKLLPTLAQINSLQALCTENFKNAPNREGFNPVK